MRKSAASSKKFISPIIGTIQPVSVNENIQKELDSKVVRTTSDILNIFKKGTCTNNVVKSVTEKENVAEVDQNSANKRLYNVVWGKKSTKKHKTWEGDGVLEVGLRSATLKDCTGTEMGRATNIKTELIEDGYILSIGGKEVQILDLIPSGTHIVSLKRSATEDNCERTFKKPKNKFTTPSPLHLNSIAKKKRGRSVHYQPLILPQPSAEHQWTFNVHKKAVTEVSVDSCLVRVLRPHQRTGVAFLYACVVGFKRENCFGAILADEMGLGKTLQCITLIWTILKQGPYGGVPILKRCLIVTPSSLTGNWEKEFSSWLGRERIQVFVIDSKNKQHYTETSHAPVAIISYEMFVRCFEELSEIHFDLLICDEGHRLKNNSIKAATLLNQLQCKRRVILTGTPIQNDLQEFYALADFVNPGCLGSNSEYRKYYVEPIVASREPEASDEIKQLGEERAKELNQKTKYFILRRSQELLDQYLPTKTEIVVFCKSSPLQRELYFAVVKLWENRDVSSREVVHLNIITALKKISNHPSLLRAHSESNEDENCLSNRLCEMLPDWNEMSPHDSGKLKVLLDLLENLSELKERVVIVSSYTQTLDMLAGVCSFHGYAFSRLDGNVPSNQRTKLVDNFNSRFSTDFIFLLSSKAGGVGLNLVGASRLVLFDNDWNPATDLQAMARVWRDGQKKSVFLYRFLTAGTIEEKIYQRQISKTGLSGTVVDPNNTKSIKMSDEELKDLFTLQFDSNCTTHTLLNCQCSGDGSIPEPTEKVEERKCQLGVEKTNENVQNLKMNQLMQWEHHKQPFDGQMLKELGFVDVDKEITYIFRNKCSS